MRSFAEFWETSLTHRVAHRGLMWLGLACGVTLTAVLAFLAHSAGANARVLIVAMIATNVVMIVPWNWSALPRWASTGIAIARGFHWIVNLMFAFFGLIMLMHADDPRRAIAFGVLSMMFALWAAAARRLTHRDPADVAAAEAGLALARN